MTTSDLTPTSRGREIRLALGAHAVGTDGVCGTVTRVVVDPTTRVVTHLLVEPKHRRGLGRLVPIDLVESSDRDVWLWCTRAEFDELELGEETRALPGNSADADYGPGHVIAWPMHSLGIAGGAIDLGAELVPNIETYDKIPIGEIAIRRGERVHALDGDVGRVHGLVIDAADHRVTRLVVDEGVWVRRRVAVPMQAVGSLDGGIRLELTKHDAHRLPPAALDRRAT